MAILTGTFGDDEIGGTLQSDLILALAGNDVVFGGGGADSIDGGTGNDTLYAGAENNIDDGDADVVNGGAGDDIIYGSAGDMLNGGTGRDTVYLDLSSANEGINADFRPMTLGLDLGLGDLIQIDLPLLTGTLGGFEIVAEVKGSAFADEFIIANVARIGARVDAGDGNDFVRTSNGNDTIQGGIGDDRLTAGGGNDRLDGGSGRDVLVGNAGKDEMSGGADNDRLSGGGSEDQLDGGAGDDILIGGRRMDVLTGGEGADRFVFSEGDSGRGRASADRITDFSKADGDRIILANVDAIAGTDEVEAFTFIGNSRFSGTAGELRFSHVGGETFVTADTDGDKLADFTLRLDGLIDFTAVDFRV